MEPIEHVLTFVCDTSRHLVCQPYSIANLHIMAQRLGLARSWFHAHPRHAHYDIPVRRIAEITAQCTVVTTREILQIIG